MRKEAQKINSLIDDCSIMSEFYHLNKANLDSIRYSKGARVRKNERGFVIGYFSLLSPEIQYSID